VRLVHHEAGPLRALRQNVRLPHLRHLSSVLANGCETALRLRTRISGFVTTISNC
jgi:hypothetical protein